MFCYFVALYFYKMDFMIRLSKYLVTGHQKITHIQIQTNVHIYTYAHTQGINQSVHFYKKRQILRKY